MTRSSGAGPNGTGPLEESAASVLFDVQSNGQGTIPAQLRRRRAASNRCEPMANGRRDPAALDKDGNRWTGTRTLHVECGRRTAWLYGGRVKQLLDHAGIDRRMWCHERRVWMIPIDRADDVLVYAEHREGRFTTVEAVDR